MHALGEQHEKGRGKKIYYSHVEERSFHRTLSAPFLFLHATLLLSLLIQFPFVSRLLLPCFLSSLDFALCLDSGMLPNKSLTFLHFTLSLYLVQTLIIKAMILEVIHQPEKGYKAISKLFIILQ